MVPVPVPELVQESVLELFSADDKPGATDLTHRGGRQGYRGHGTIWTVPVASMCKAPADVRVFRAL